MECRYYQDDDGLNGIVQDHTIVTNNGWITDENGLSTTTSYYDVDDETGLINFRIDDTTDEYGIQKQSKYILQPHSGGGYEEVTEILDNGWDINGGITTSWYQGSGLNLLRYDTTIDTFGLERSEERRVGKECRSRWSPYH